MSWYELTIGENPISPILTTSPGTFNLLGYDASESFTPPRMDALPGSFALTGEVAALTTSGLKIGFHFNVDGSATQSSNGFPIFKNQVRSGRGFTSTSSPYSAQVALDSSGWPAADFSCFLYEGGQNGTTWATNNNGIFLCGFIDKSAGTSTASVSSTGIGGTISNLVHGAAGTYTTFSLKNTGSNFGFIVTGTGGGATNVFAFLPAYASSAPAAGTSGPIDNPMASSAFTTEALNFYPQFSHVRWSGWQNVGYNAAENTSATRRTYSNMQSKQTWSASGSNVEGYTADWAASFCAACNIGCYICLPVWEDGTNAYGADGSAGTYSNSLLTMLNSVMVPTGQPIYLEIGNELWNGDFSAIGYGSTGKLNSLATTSIDPNTGLVFAANNTAYQSVVNYLGYRYSRLAAMCRTIFGSAFGSQVKIVFTWQSAPGGWDQVASTLTYMLSHPGYYNLQGASNNDIQYLCNAPYYNLYTSVQAPWTNTFTGVAASGVLTVSSAQNSSIAVGNYVIGTGIPVGTTISSFGSGAGGNGTYNLSTSVTASSGRMYTCTTSNPSVAQIQSALSTITNNAAWGSQTELYSIEATFVGCQHMTYEGGFQVNAEPQGMANMTSAIMDSGMAAIVQNHWTQAFNAGAAIITHFDGAASGKAGGLYNDYSPVDEMSNNYSALISTGAPTLSGIQAVERGVTITRNVVSAKPTTIYGGNYADNFSSGSSATFSSQSSSYKLGLYTRAIGYQVYCTIPGSFTLTCAASASFSTALVVNTALISSSFNVSGGSATVTLNQGFNTIIFGSGVSSSATITSFVFS